jgi:hypothetical protein
MMHKYHQLGTGALFLTSLAKWGVVVDSRMVLEMVHDFFTLGFVAIPTGQYNGSLVSQTMVSVSMLTNSSQRQVSWFSSQSTCIPVVTNDFKD